MVGSIYFSEINAQGLTEPSYLAGPSYLTHQGIAKDDRVNPLRHVVQHNYYGKTPVLSAFSLSFDSGVAKEIDEVLINTQVGGGWGDAVELNFTNYSGPYNYGYSLALIEPGFVLAEGSIEGRCNRNWCQRRLPPPPQPDAVLVLRSFMFKFNTYHRLKKIVVYQDRGQLKFEYHDRGKDDAFDFSARYVYLPRSMFKYLGKLNGTEEGGHTIPLLYLQRRGIPVIRGFRFDFIDGRWSRADHNIHAIKVNLRTNGTAQLAYMDENARADYTYKVWYGILK